MKSHKYMLSFLIIFSVLNLTAQPLPPTTPDGNPVPLGDIVLLVFLAGTLLVWKHKEKK